MILPRGGHESRCSSAYAGRRKVGVGAAQTTHNVDQTIGIYRKEVR
jgi:hypothetical protein